MNNTAWNFIQYHLLFMQLLLCIQLPSLHGSIGDSTESDEK